jgi:hypothetical protein
MTPYRFLTTFAIPAPQEAVFEALSHLERWASYWPEMRTFAVTDEGGPDGIGRSVALIVRAPSGYVIGMQLTTERRDPPGRLDVVAEGDVTGRGSWRLMEDDGVTHGSYLWEVATTKRWMNVLAPVARPLFEWNHGRAIRSTLQGLATYLGVEPLHVTTNGHHRRQAAGVG